MADIREKNVKSVSGIPMLLLLIGVIILGVCLLIFMEAVSIGLPLALIGVPALLIGASGLYKVEPNQSAVLSLFGKYIGTVRTPGLRFNNPQIQSEAAIRAMATSYPYDQHSDGEISLRSHPKEISDRLRDEIQDRLAQAGINVIEARISHLAYSPEIAGAMLQRQQAGAIIAARKKIVEGAVGMVEDAIEGLSKKNIVQLDEERKATMVSNLLVVLCSDKATQPVVNTGSLY